MRIEAFGITIELSRRTVYVQSPAGELWAERCAAWRLDFWKANGALYFHLGPFAGNASR